MKYFFKNNRWKCDGKNPTLDGGRGQLGFTASEALSSEGESLETSLATSIQITQSQTAFYTENNMAKQLIDLFPGCIPQTNFTPLIQQDERLDKTLVGSPAFCLNIHFYL